MFDSLVLWKLSFVDSFKWQNLGVLEILLNILSLIIKNTSKFKISQNICNETVLN